MIYLKGLVPLCDPVGRLPFVKGEREGFKKGKKKKEGQKPPLGHPILRPCY
jgi:hypothetical protein